MPTQNLAAYDAFLKGEEPFARSFGSNVAPDLRKALGFYEQAVALDPGFAQAWAQVSAINSYLYSYEPTPSLAERARQAAEKAVALAPARAEGYLALGTYEERVVRDSNRALEQFARAARVAPANTVLITAMAGSEMALGRWDAALEHLRQVERLDPRS
jgi:tetratricopeptide (TPR) repeat protein